MMRIIAS